MADCCSRNVISFKLDKLTVSMFIYIFSRICDGKACDVCHSRKKHECNKISVSDDRKSGVERAPSDTRR